MPKVRHFQALADSRNEYSGIIEKPNSIHSSMTLEKLGYLSVDDEFIEDYMALEYLVNLVFMRYHEDLFKPSCFVIERVFGRILKSHETTMINMKAMNVSGDIKRGLNRIDNHTRGMCELYPERFRTNDIWVQKLPEVIYK